MGHFIPNVTKFFKNVTVPIQILTFHLKAPSYLTNSCILKLIKFKKELPMFIKPAKKVQAEPFKGLDQYKELTSEELMEIKGGDGRNTVNIFDLFFHRK